MKTLKLKYDVLCCVGHIVQVEIWEDENQLHYSWHHDFARQKRWTEPKDAVCDTSVEELNRLIDNLRENCEISNGKLVMDPSSYTLDLVNRDGEEIHYRWSDDDNVSQGLKDFLTAIEGIIGDMPFSLYK